MNDTPKYFVLFVDALRVAYFELAPSILSSSPDSETNSIIKMIYATLSCGGVSCDRNYFGRCNWNYVAQRRAADTKGCRDRKRVLRRWVRAGEETRDIYRCRVRCEVVPRVTGIRFPGAAVPCRETGPSFTSRTSLDLIHAPLRAR